MTGIADIDIVQSTGLLGQNAEEARAVFEQWHKVVDTVLGRHGGREWTRAGDGVLYTFEELPEAADGCLHLIEEMGSFNEAALARLGMPIYIRIGLAHSDSDSILAIPPDRRTRAAEPDINVAGHLQKHCPVGGLAISRRVYEAIGIRTRMFRPASSGALRALGAFVCLSRQSMPYAEGLLAGLTRRQRLAIPPFLALDWDRLAPDRSTSLLDLHSILGGPVLVVLGGTDRHPRSRVRRGATSDMVVLAELLASTQSNPRAFVKVDECEDAADLASSNSLVVVGSGLANTYASVINDLIEPVRFDKHDGLVFNRILGSGHDQYGRLRRWEFGERSPDEENSGLVVVAKSPFGPAHHVLWIAGISGAATQAASRFAADMVSDPIGTLRRTGLAAGAPPIGCVVVARTDTEDGDLDAEEREGPLRVCAYDVVWAVDATGHATERHRG